MASQRAYFIRRRYWGRVLYLRLLKTSNGATVKRSEWTEDPRLARKLTQREAYDISHACLVQEGWLCEAVTMCLSCRNLVAVDEVRDAARRSKKVRLCRDCIEREARERTEHNDRTHEHNEGP